MLFKKKKELRPKGKIGHFHICLFDCKILTECAILKCKVSFFSGNSWLSEYVLTINVVW